jgi:hypothetical protein
MTRKHTSLFSSAVAWQCLFSCRLGRTPSNRDSIGSLGIAMYLYREMVSIGVWHGVVALLQLRRRSMRSTGEFWALAQYGKFRLPPYLHHVLLLSAPRNDEQMARPRASTIYNQGTFIRGGEDITRAAARGIRLYTPTRLFVLPSASLPRPCPSTSSVGHSLSRI